MSATVFASQIPRHITSTVLLIHVLARTSVTVTPCENTTTLLSGPDTYWGQFDEISKYHVHLNIFERLWAAWYAFMQNDVLATGIMSFVMHEVVYFGRSLPWIIMDRLPYFNRYKIQNVRNHLSRSESDGEGTRFGDSSCADWT
ncbi:MAG: C-4 sterol methyl oxidase [Sclerophora amabilis]|nr:MAG: C-4 sterol methyl oxidase [Sclerophora amabilis]